MVACRCGPCQLLTPQLEKAAAHFSERVRFLKIDSDEEPDVASILKINGSAGFCISVVPRVAIPANVATPTAMSG